MENPKQKWMMTGGTAISGNLHIDDIRCLMPHRPRTLHSGQILCFGALAWTHGPFALRLFGWRTPRIQTSPWIWAQIENPKSGHKQTDNIQMCLFAILFAQRLQRQAGWQSIWGSAFYSRPRTATQMALEMPKRMMDCDDGEWMFNIFEDVPCVFQIWRSLGKKRSLREQVAVCLNLNDDWTQVSHQPGSLYHPMRKIKTSHD